MRPEGHPGILAPGAETLEDPELSPFSPLDLPRIPATLSPPPGLQEKPG